jgi:hypothetical protein
MTGMMVMFCHVGIGRSIAAECHTTSLAGSQMDPLVTGFDTLFANQLLGLFQGFYFRDVLAGRLLFHKK